MNDIPTESTSTSSHTPINLEDLEKEAKELDEELKKMIKRGGKNGVNLDAIEERSEKRNTRSHNAGKKTNSKGIK